MRIDPNKIKLNAEEASSLIDIACDEGIDFDELLVCLDNQRKSNKFMEEVKKFLTYLSKNFKIVKR